MPTFADAFALAKTLGRSACLLTTEVRGRRRVQVIELETGKALMTAWCEQMTEEESRVFRSSQRYDVVRMTQT